VGVSLAPGPFALFPRECYRAHNSRVQNDVGVSFDHENQSFSRDYVAGRAMAHLETTHLSLTQIVVERHNTRMRRSFSCFMFCS
jgi:hypothetical protein